MTSAEQHRKSIRTSGTEKYNAVLGKFVSRRRFFNWMDDDGRKVPVGDDGYPHDHADYRIHKSLREAVAKDAEHVGVALGQGFDLDGNRWGDALCGIDGDACRDPNTGILTPWGSNLVSECDSSTEVSHSGTGVHPYFGMTGIEYRKLLSSNGGHYQATRAFNEDSVARLSKHEPTITLFLGKRFFVTTGQVHGRALPLRYVTANEVMSLVRGLKLAWSNDDSGDYSEAIDAVVYDDKLAARHRAYIAKNDTLLKRVSGDPTGLKKDRSPSGFGQSYADVMVGGKFTREEVKACMLSVDSGKIVSEWADRKQRALDWTINKAFDEAGVEGTGEQWPTALWDVLSLDAWMDLDIPPPDRLLGDLLTTTSRVLLAGYTGIGKTTIGLAMAIHVAMGKDFLHWKCHRAARVLYIDGEMSGRRMKGRALDAYRRAAASKGVKLAIYSHDMGEKLMGDVMPPLNTPEGHDYVLKLIDKLGGVDAAFFDNVMSLLEGTQKEEEGWNGVNPLIATLTRRSVGQIWLDHTGHANPDRPYGTSTKMWRMDTVGAMTPLGSGELIAFKLSFEHPGKARDRDANNWQDFATNNIRLNGDEWVVDEGDIKSMPAWAQKWRHALERAIDRSLTPNETTMDAWEAECRKPHGGEPALLKEINASDDSKTKDSKRAMFRNARNMLEKIGAITVDRGRVINNAKD